MGSLNNLIMKNNIKGSNGLISIKAKPPAKQKKTTIVLRLITIKARPPRSTH